MKRLLPIVLIGVALVALMVVDASAKSGDQEGSWVRQQLQLQLKTQTCTKQCAQQCDESCELLQKRQRNEDSDPGAGGDRDRTRGGIRQHDRDRDCEDDPLELLLWLLGA